MLDKTDRRLSHNRRKRAPNQIDIHVGGRIKMRRMALGLSQSKLSEPLNLTFQQVQKYENGTNRVGSSRLKQIADILDVPVSFFFEGAPGYSENKGVSDDPLRTLAMTRQGINLAIAFNKISDDVMRLAIIQLARAAAGIQEDE